jgi:hypothetical protein
MDVAARVLLALAFVWAVSGLAFAARRALKHGARTFASPVGSPSKAVFYNFTTAMLPSHKESVSRHLFSFATGTIFHLAVFASLAAVLASAVCPATFDLGRRLWQPVAAVGIAACLVLLVRRLKDRELRTVSVPEDFLANGLVGIFLAAVMTVAGRWLPLYVLHFATAVLFLYMPLGKLRHAVFFFLARADLGRRLGWRGVYPPGQR